MGIDKLEKIQIADKVLMHFNDHEMTDEYSPFIKAGFVEAEVEGGQHSRTIIAVIKILEDLGYIEQTGNSGQWFLLTEKGREVKNSGGHFAYINKLNEKAKADTERQHLNDEKLAYDVKNAKRIFKTYWWTFAISITALLISLFNLIYYLFIRKN